MAELFLNPWTMIAGLLLVSVPVLIHLINRMRFRRVRWAAMEFLLKAQKRMKRKLIFQQLLLLALRMLLVALIGVLVGRFLGFNPLDARESRTTSHTVILDDSPSMGDVWRGDDGQMTDAFKQATKTLVDQIAPAAAEATTPQTLDVYRLSDLATPRSFGRLNPATIDEAKSYLATFRPTYVRRGLADALKAVKESLDRQGTEAAQVIHVLSDFRSPDWATDGPAVRAQIEALTAAKAKVHLVDVSHPFRADSAAKKVLLFHDNISIVELRPSKAVVARFEEAEFLLRVRNFGGTELKDVRVAVAVNGDDNKGKSVSFPVLPAKEEKTLKFGLTFDRVGTADKPTDRFSLVTARIESGEAGGLSADNVRHAVVEVREKLPILVVEGRPNLRDKKDGDGFYLQRMFTSVLGGFTWKSAAAADLEKLDLKGYSLVFLLNVPTLGEPAAKALDSYVRDGGGVGFFLGPDVKPAEYNKLLYADGAGIFPVPLPEKPSDPLTDDAKLQRMFTLQKKLLLRDKATRSHPALANIYFDERGNPLREDEFEKFFSFVVVGQYWPVKRLGKWRDDPATTELYCMPNDAAMGSVEKEVRDVVDRVPVNEPKYAKFKDAINPLVGEIRRTAASTEPLFKLANLFDRLLSDQRTDGNATEALIREFWAQPELADLRTEIARRRDSVKYGDPLYLAKTVGKGRVTAVLTTAGETWTDWPTGPGRPSFVPIVTEMERYLSGGGSDDAHSCGDPVRLAFDATRYKPIVNRAFVTADEKKAAAAATAPELVDLKEQATATEAGAHVLTFTEATKPGVYLFTATKLGTPGAADASETPEYHAVAVNIDARREGDLRRAERDDILQSAPGAGLHSPGSAEWLEELKNRKTDLTEAGWIFLVLILVLVAEQALAVRLSFHTATGTTPADARPAFRRDPAPEPTAA